MPNYKAIYPEQLIAQLDCNIFEILNSGVIRKKLTERKNVILPPLCGSNDH